MLSKLATNYCIAGGRSGDINAFGRLEGTLLWEMIHFTLESLSESAYVCYSILRYGLTISLLCPSE